MKEVFVPLLKSTKGVSASSYEIGIGNGGNAKNNRIRHMCSVFILPVFHRFLHTVLASKRVFIS